MTWKNNLRPNKHIILIYAILVIAAVPFIKYATGIVCVTVPCPSETVGTLFSYMVAQQPSVISISYVNLFVGVILSYLFACGVVAVFNDLLTKGKSLKNEEIAQAGSCEKKRPKKKSRK
jgi:hypothetical protein